MADRSTSRTWQVFLVIGLITCVTSFHFVIGSGTFAVVSGLIALSVTLLNAFLSPATADPKENWFVGVVKRLFVVGRYAKVVCVALWVTTLIGGAILAKTAYDKAFNVDIEGIVIDELPVTPVEKAFVDLHLGDGTTIRTQAAAGQFAFAVVDRRKAASGKTYLEASWDGVHAQVPIDLSKGSVRSVRITLPISRPDLAGRVVDSDGRPVNDAKVILETAVRGNLSTVFTRDGDFIFRKLEPQRVFVRAEKSGVSNEIEIDLRENWRGPTTTLKLALKTTSPIKRTFVVLQGRSVDILVRDRKLPSELEKSLGGTVTLIGSTPAFKELASLMARFSMSGDDPDSLEARVRGPEQDRDGLSEEINYEQMQKLVKTRVLGATSGYERDHDMKYDLPDLPSEFFVDAPWQIGADSLCDSVKEGAGAQHIRRSLFEVSLDEGIMLSKFATRADIGALRSKLGRSSVDEETGRGAALFRFYDYVSRKGMPEGFMVLTVWAETCMGMRLKIEAPALELRVVVLENVTEKPVELGNFFFRVAAAGPGGRLIRTIKENANEISAITPIAKPLYGPRILRPGEKVVVPLELILSFRHSWLEDFEDSGEDDEGSEPKKLPEEPVCGFRESAEALRASQNIKTVALVYESSGDTSKKTTFLRMTKEKFIDALLRDVAIASKTEEYVYGPSAELDAIEVDGNRHAIEPFNPVYVAYLAGYGLGSCPFVYCRRTGEHWVKQGSILRGRNSKRREGTSELMVRRFDGTVKIAEEEAEISYVDELFVRAKSTTGQDIILRPADERLVKKDGRYVVLKKGESMEIDLAVPKGMRLERVRIGASGFFEPTFPSRRTKSKK